jgi:hypothetical protein
MFVFSYGLLLQYNSYLTVSQYARIKASSSDRFAEIAASRF